MSPFDGGTESHLSMNRVNGWLENCLSSHKRCAVALVSSDNNPPLPTRVLDLGFRESDPIRLVETRGEKGHYTCLSYCWGNSAFIKTTKATIGRYQENIGFDELPPTFQDSVKITRGLGIRYLWIDALCIVQDDAKDWKREAVRMAHVYQNSCLTISATWADSPKRGLFSSRTILEEEPFISRVFEHAEADGTEMIQDEDSPVLARGWTFQERLLSPRILHFRKWEIGWECTESIACECHFSTYAKNTELFEHASRFERLKLAFSRYIAGEEAAGIVPEKLWKMLVGSYSSRNLSIKSDRLVAISGVADLIQRRTGWQYLAGLWKETLLQDLGWAAGVSSKIAKLKGFGSPHWQAAEQFERRFPTWSWASIDESVSWPGEQWLTLRVKDTDWMHHAQVIDAGCTLATSSPTGPVLDGFIDMECPLAPIRYTELRILTTLNRYNSSVVTLDQGISASPYRKDGPFYLAPLCTIDSWQQVALILMAAKCSPNCMVRIGSCWWGYNEEASASCLERMIINWKWKLAFMKKRQRIRIV